MPMLRRLLLKAIACIVMLQPLLASAAAQTPGERQFQRCINCHQIGPSARHGFGPSLTGVMGRQSGSASGYSYSSAMKNSKIVWDEKTLSAFLKNPDGVVPGTRMRLWGYNDDQQIRDLIAYLKSYPAPASR